MARAGPWQTALPGNPENIVNEFQGFMRIQSDLGWFNFQSQTSGTDGLIKVLQLTTFPVQQVLSHAVSNSIQQEFLFSSKRDSRIQWVGGLFLYDANAGYAPIINGTTLAVGSHINNSVRTLSAAPFGEVTIPITDRLSITGGLRYTWEQKNLTGYEAGTATRKGPFVSAGKTWTNLSPRVIVAYDIPNMVNFYASFSEGFKSGVYQTTINRQTPVNPESLTAYEIGAKTLVSGIWRASASVFDYDDKNVQISSRISVGTPPLPTNVLFNAGSAQIYGVEFEGEVQATPDLSLNAFVSYTHGVYTQFNNAVTYVPEPIGGNVLKTISAAGKPTIRTPPWTVGFNPYYAHDFGRGLVEVTVNAYYNGGESWEPGDRVKQAPYATLDSSVSWSPGNSRYKITLWGTNLSNAAYFQFVTVSPAGDYANYARPRSVGGRLAVKF